MNSLPHADDVAIRTDLPDLIIHAELHLMRRVFTNLILNALQAMPKGGTSEVESFGRIRDQPR